MSDEKRAHDSGLRGEPGSADAATPGPVAGEPVREHSAAPESQAASAPQPASAARTESAGDAASTRGAEAPVRTDGVYFFPEETVTAAEVRALIQHGSRSDKARVVSHLLTYAEYAEIWTWVDRELVRELFDELQLPDRLRTAWARNLGLVAKAK